jgi:hypothetical protein
MWDFGGIDLKTSRGHESRFEVNGLERRENPIHHKGN